MANSSKQAPASVYVEGILQGNRVLLSRAITLVESKRPHHQKLAREIIEKCLPHTGQSIRIGITGSPGVGKSSFIEAFGTYLADQHHRKIAVLAIDPSSQKSKGSILGDKTRMDKLSIHPNAFIRPSAAGTSLGGVATKTRESMLLCEAAGFDTIFIETVGVGQSEIAVHGMVDFFLLLLLPGAGDELQGIKRGIVEMADLIAINKADGDRVELAKAARKDYAQALHLFPMKESGWTPKAVTCSATERQGMTEVWDLLQKYFSDTKTNAWFDQHRKEQAQYWLHELLELGLKDLFYQTGDMRNQLSLLEKAVLNGQLSSNLAARKLLNAFKEQLSPHKPATET